MKNLKTDAIQWHEGMLLQPHHFQQSDLHMRNLLTFHLDNLTPFYWGVKSFIIDPLQLIAGSLVLLEVEAVMPDGLVVIKTIEHEPILAELAQFKDLFQQGAVKAYLAVPKYIKGKDNAGGSTPRWSSRDDNDVVDENTGEKAIAVPELSPNAFISIGTPPSFHYSWFPLCELVLEENTFKLTAFSAPCVTFTSNHSVMDLISDLCVKIRSKIMYLISKIQHPSQYEDLRYLEEYIKILSSGLMPVEVLLHTPKLHPFQTYYNLCVLAGSVYGLNTKLLPPILPSYDHNNMYGCFVEVCNFINSMISHVQEVHSNLSFQYQDNKFTISLIESYIENSYILVGFSAKTGTLASDISAWVKEAVICSASVMQQVMENRVLGARREIVDYDSVFDVASNNQVILLRIYMDSKFIQSKETLVIFNNLHKNKDLFEKLLLYVKK